jgi:hypothetical protein
MTACLARSFFTISILTGFLKSDADCSIYTLGCFILIRAGDFESLRVSDGDFDKPINDRGFITSMLFLFSKLFAS